MNRIYQGRVTKVEIPNPDPSTQKDQPWIPLSKKPAEAKTLGENLLWEHHQLFQDAVNYYLVALASLGHSPQSTLTELKGRIMQSWHSFEKQGQRREGMSESFRRRFGDQAAQSFSAAAGVAQDGGLPNAEEAERCALFLMEKATGDSGIQQQGSQLWPQFCNPAFSGNFSGGDADEQKEQGLYILSTKLHEIATDEQSLRAFANERRLSEVVKTDPEGATHEDSKARLEKAVNHFLKVLRPELRTANNKGKNEDETINFIKTYDQAQTELETILRKIHQQTDFETIVKNNKGNSDQIEALLLFKFFPSTFTLGLLKAQFPHRPDAKPPENTDDSQVNFAAARGSRKYIFRAFTSLSIFGSSHAIVNDDNGWALFDIAAFKEALKVVNQFNQNRKNREDKLNELATRLLVMDGETSLELYAADGTDGKIRSRMERIWRECNGKPKIAAATKDEAEEGASLPTFKNDPRIAKLKLIIGKELAEEYRLTEGRSTPYGLRRRTIKGWGEIKRLWRQKTKPGMAFSEPKKQELKKLLDDLRKEKPEQIGSHRLFEALLADEDAWRIWREPTEEEAKEIADKNWAEDPLEAFRQFRETCESLEEISGRDLRFTPAEARYSRRLFSFTDVCTFGNPRGEYRHDSKALAVTVPAMVKNSQGHFQKTTLRLTYSAPRLLRDQIRSETGEYVQQWVQPMVRALLGDDHQLSKQKLEDSAVQLMPDWDKSGNRRMLLNFPMDFSTKQLEVITSKPRWKDQFVRWKKGTQKGTQLLFLGWKFDFNEKVKNRWFEVADSFHVLSADLGTRHAASIALLEATSDPSLSTKGRFIGNDGSRDWWALYRGGKTLKLAGEDAQVVRHRNKQDSDVNPKLEQNLQEKDFREELYGSRGRSASVDESEQSIRLLTYLNQLELLPENCRTLDQANELTRHLSFPEQNDKLLVAIRRTQGHLADLISIHWRLVNPEKPKQKEDALQEWREQKRYPEKISLADEPDKLAEFIKVQIEFLRKKIQEHLLTTTNRILPLRGRKWEFIEHPDQEHFPLCHLLQQTQEGTDTEKKHLGGQRGLSMARIEQISELRRRWQSLNQSLRRKLGERPPTASEMRNDPIPDPCPNLLLKMENLREQRVNQTAHLILAEALGVRLRVPKLDHQQREDADIHGEYERIPGRQPVDFIVLEDLSRYLTYQGRAKSENTRLMKWCHRQVTAKVKELAEPFGIPVLETPAAYSSRFCSQTGMAGFRCVEIGPDDRHSFPWKSRLQEYHEKGELASDEAKFAAQLFSLLDKANAGRSGKTIRTLLAPQPGGPIFVTAQSVPSPFSDKNKPVLPVNADINAAINLGLRAIASPDCADIQHRLRTKRKSEKNEPDKFLTSEKRRFGEQPCLIEVRPGDTLPKDKNPNLFYDPHGLAEFDRAKLSSQNGNQYDYASGRGLWKKVNDWDVQRARCMEINRARLKAWGIQTSAPATTSSEPPEDDDIPY
jgi:hypothetical protein